LVGHSMGTPTTEGKVKEKCPVESQSKAREKDKTTRETFRKGDERNQTNGRGEMPDGGGNQGPGRN